MNRLTRLLTAKTRLAADVAIVIQSRSQTFRLTRSDLLTYDTPDKLVRELRRQIGAEQELSYRTFFHRNRNGSIAVAVGQEPTVWPEDDASG